MKSISSAKSISAAKTIFNKAYDSLDIKYSQDVDVLFDAYRSKVKELVLPSIVNAAKEFNEFSDASDIWNSIAVNFNEFYYPPRVFMTIYFIEYDSIALECILEDRDSKHMIYDIVIDGVCEKQSIHSQKSAIKTFLGYVQERKKNLFGHDSKKYLTDIQRKYNEFYNASKKYASLMIKRISDFLTYKGFNDKEFRVYWKPDSNPVGDMVIYVNFDALEVDIKYSCLLNHWLIDDEAHFYNDHDIITEIKNRIGNDTHITIQI